MLRQSTKRRSGQLTETASAEQRQHNDGNGGNGEPQRGRRRVFRVSAEQDDERACDCSEDDQCIEAVIADQEANAFHEVTLR